MPSINDQIRNAELFINNMSQSPGVQLAFADVGRDGDYVQEGQQLLDAVKHLYQQQQDAYGDQYGASKDLEEIRDAAHDTYMEHLGFARIVFETDPDAQRISSCEASGGGRWTTVQRDQALDRLNDWVSQNRRIARVLFRNDPQQMEALGIRV